MKDKSSNAAAMGSRNGGVTRDGKVRQDFGLDKSSYAGSASAERGKSLGGSTTNISHSISGSSANQKLKS